MPEQQTVEKIEQIIPKQNSVKNLLNGVKDLATLKLRKPVHARVLERRKEIEELSQAKTHTIMITDEVREHVTEAPQMFITKLSCQVRDGKGIITYYKYKTETDKETGEVRKVYNTTMRPSPFTGKEIEHSKEPIIDKLVKETIEQGKPIQVEEVNYNG